VWGQSQRGALGRSVDGDARATQPELEAPGAPADPGDRLEPYAGLRSDRALREITEEPLHLIGSLFETDRGHAPSLAATVV
jgi:hypothetical protein